MQEPGRVAIVTGGARGIGAAVCEALLADGLCVAVVDLDREAAAQLATTLDASGERAIGFAADVSNGAAVDAMVSDVVATFGRLDVLVNNAGITHPSPTQDIGDDDWDRLVGVHLGGTFRCSRAAFPHLSRHGGAIVSTASVAARVGFSKRASYCAAKGGILALTRCLAVEWAPYGIRVNAVAPGHTRTQMLDDAISHGVLPPERVEARVGRIPMGRMAEPREIADGIAFLASPKASYITGETLYIDGAFSVNGDELPVVAG